MRVIYDINPCAKPRMTQRDKWAKRPPVLRYFAFKDECKLRGVKVPHFGAHIVFHVPMPKSWSDKKKNEYVGTPHLQRPDKDNLEKALLDAIYEEDSTVWDSRVTKLWSYFGKIEVLK
jgi:hypothetical protein